MSSSESRLVRAWAVLMALSLALAVAAESARPQKALLAWVAVIVVVAFWKARIVLSVYLDLRRAPSALSGFSLAIAVILAIVAASFALQAFIATFA